MAVQHVLARVSARVSAQIGLPKRLQSTISTADVEKEWANAKPFSEIPGPKPLPILGNFWRMMPFGTYHGLDTYNMLNKIIEEYGEISRLEGLGRPPMVMITDPNDIALVYRTEGPWPIRTGVESIDYYRRHMRKEVFGGNPGLATTQGEEWQVNRTAANQPMMRPKNVGIYKKPLEETAQEFIQRIKTIRDANLEMPKDFDNELSKWALESIARISLDTRLGCLEGELKPGDDAQIMITNVDTMFRMLYELDFKPSLWKHISTPNWKRFVNAMDNITNICLKYINKKKGSIADRQSAGDPAGQSVLEVMLRTPEGEKMAIIISIDLLTGGVDTTSASVANALYYLAKNPEVQQKAFREIKEMLPHKDSELPENFDNSIRYLKACIKETQRIANIVFGNGRNTGKDLILKGYRIPKNTLMSIPNLYMCNSNEHYPRANEFIPERWLVEKDDPVSSKHTQPFVFMPFGFGPRMCIGRRMAEMEMKVILSKIIRNFEIKYNYGDMVWRWGAISAPAKPLQFQLIDRND